MKNKNLLLPLVGFLLLFVGTFIRFQKSPTVTETNTVSPTPKVLGVEDENGVVVKRVVDGDTIELENSQKVRYIGINTPESVDPRRPVQCYGKEASAFNKQLVEGKRVRLVKDISETDKYGRLLRYVYLIPQGSIDKEVFVNEYLVRQGYANAVSYPPDIAFQNLFQTAEREARLNNRGLWAACTK